MKCPDYGGNMNRGISPLMASVLMIALAVGITWVVSEWIEEHYPAKDEVRDENWTCVEWRNETIKAIFPNAKTVKCYTDDYKVYAVAYNETGGWSIDINLEDLPKEIECPKIIREDIVKQTCIKEGFNCRNETKYYYQNVRQIWNKGEDIIVEPMTDWKPFTPSETLPCPLPFMYDNGTDKIQETCDFMDITETVCDEYREGC